MIRLQSFRINSIKKSVLGGFCHFLFGNVHIFYLIDFGVPKMGFLVFSSGGYLEKGEGEQKIHHLDWASPKIYRRNQPSNKTNGKWDGGAVCIPNRWHWRQGRRDEWPTQSCARAVRWARGRLQHLIIKSYGPDIALTVEDFIRANSHRQVKKSQCFCQRLITTILIQYRGIRVGWTIQPHKRCW